jgi:O-antigen ligase
VLPVKTYWKEYPLYLFALLICTAPELLPGSLLLIIACSPLLGFQLNKMKENYFNPKNVFIWMTLYFLWQFVGLANSEDQEMASLNLILNLSFLLLPLIVLSTKLKFDLDRILSVFTIGAVAAVITALIRATYFYLSEQTTEYFYETKFTYSMHRSYWATYMVIACAWILYKMIRNKTIKPLNILGIIVLATGILLSGSKAGVLTFLASILALTAFSLFTLKNKLFTTIFIGSLVVLVLVLFSLFPNVRQRFNNMFDKISHTEELDINSTESNTARLLVWETSWEIIKENPLWGIGTGDVLHELQKRNSEKGYTGVVSLNLNAHNQFLNTQLALGVFGTFFLLLIFLIPIFYPNPDYSFFIRLIIFIFLTTMLTESFLERQSGIMPFAFLIGVFGAMNKK